MGTETLSPNPWMMLPFVVLLGTIALGSAVRSGLVGEALSESRPCAWERSRWPIISSDCMRTTRVLHVAHEYLSFIALIGSLFIVSGGIHINVKGEATPAT